MIAPRGIIINGKFLAHELTGVHRVGTELIRQCHELLAEDTDLAARVTIELWVPPRGRERAAKLGVPFRVVRPLEGVAWGQLTLPLAARGRTVLSFGNVGPLLTRNAVTMIQDAQVHSTPKSYGPLFRLWYRFHQPIAGRRHKRILTVSEFSRVQLGRYGIAGPQAVAVIRNGADHVLRDRPDESIVGRLGLEAGRYVVALANIQPHKNISLLLAVFAADEMREITLVLFGAATRRDFENAGMTVPQNVCFAGRLRDDELWGLYAQALCLAFPSLTEGFGLPPLEAMMMGCPAIVAPRGALPETCGDAAAYADPYDAKPWRDAILAMRDDRPARETLVAKGRAWARQFTWKSAAIQVMAELLTL